MTTLSGLIQDAKNNNFTFTGSFKRCPHCEAIKKKVRFASAKHKIDTKPWLNTKPTMAKFIAPDDSPYAVVYACPCGAREVIRRKHDKGGNTSSNSGTKTTSTSTYPKKSKPIPEEPKPSKEENTPIPEEPKEPETEQPDEESTAPDIKPVRQDSKIKNYLHKCLDLIKQINGILPMDKSEDSSTTPQVETSAPKEITTKEEPKYKMPTPQKVPTSPTAKEPEVPTGKVGSPVKLQITNVRGELMTVCIKAGKSAYNMTYSIERVFQDYVYKLLNRHKDYAALDYLNSKSIWKEAVAAM